MPSTECEMSGTLYIVATPMGNLEDITFRAVRILKEADLIAAEDTRHSRTLLAHYGITTPMTACHEHNEENRANALTRHLAQGKTIALISDAGTPLISDPGYKLVRQAARQDIPVVPVPGCNAAVTGLSAAGLPTDTFLFCGFPPKKPGRRTTALTGLKSRTATLIFYESPKRIQSLIASALEIFGDRDACLARELTKRHEEFIRGSLSGILERLAQRERVRGECVLFITGAAGTGEKISEEELEALIRKRLADNPKTKDLARELAEACKLPKKQIYNTILALRG